MSTSGEKTHTPTHTPLEMLKAIMLYGELACVSTGPHWGSSGKKPSTKDVWQFPRHMLPDIEAAIALATPAEGERTA